VAVKYIIGGLDRFVSESSAKGQWGTEHCETIIGKGHRDIVKPTTADDLAFLIARQFMLSEDLNQAFRAVTAAKPMVPSKATTEDRSSQVHLPTPIFAFTDTSSQPAADTAMQIGRDDLRILAANVRCPSAELQKFFDFKRQQNDDRIRVLEQYNSVENILEIAAAPLAGNGVQWGWDPMCITATVVGNLDPLPAIHDQELYESLSRDPPNKPKFVFAEEPCALPDNESYVTFKLKRTDFIQTVLASRALARDPSLRDLYGDYNSAENRFPYGTSVELIVLLIDGTILVCQKGRQSIHEGGKWSVSSEETLDDTDFR